MRKCVKTSKPPSHSYIGSLTLQREMRMGASPVEELVEWIAEHDAPFGDPMDPPEQYLRRENPRLLLSRTGGLPRSSSECDVLVFRCLIGYEPTYRYSLET